MDKPAKKMDYFMKIMSSIQTRCEQEVGKFLKRSGLRFSRLSDIPLREIRHAQRGALPDMRMAHLANNLCEDFLQRPITRDLLCTRVGYQGPSPAHYIPRPTGSCDFIMIYCIDGRGWVEIENQERLVQKHDAFLIPAHLPHKYGADPDAPWSNYWIHFRGRQAGDYCKLIAHDASNPIFHLYYHEEVAAGIEQLYQQMGAVHTYSTLVASSGTLGQLLGTVQMRMRAAEQRSRSAEESIDKSVEFMHRNLSCKLTLRELANIAGMSMNHYGTLFGKRYYSTPIDYFNRLKIQRACELLTTSNLRVSEVGEQLGFPDPYYFSRLFKKIMGVSPRDYR